MKNPWTEEPGGLQSKGLQRVEHDRAWTHNAILLPNLYPCVWGGWDLSFYCLLGFLSFKIDTSTGLTMCGICFNDSKLSHRTGRLGINLVLRKHLGIGREGIMPLFVSSSIFSLPEISLLLFSWPYDIEKQIKHSRTAHAIKTNKQTNKKPQSIHGFWWILSWHAASYRGLFLVGPNFKFQHFSWE